MKNLFYIAIVFLVSCRFDAGIRPGDKNSPEKDMQSDTSGKASDASKDSTGDLSTNDMAIVDLSNDMKGDGGSDGGSDLGRDLGMDASPDLGPMCNQSPVDLNIDINHCGVCDNACDPNFSSCNAGNCICPTNAEPCGPSNTCKDTQNDPFNCGACGNSCGLASECVGGNCVCRDGYRDCNGECVDLESNPNHCGECGKVCSGSKSKCNGGDCERTCFGKLACDVANQTSCTRPDDYFHCNARLIDSCGTECGVGEACVKVGIFKRKCVKIRPTIACQTCPCNECTSDEKCEVSNFSGHEVFCAEK